MLCWAVGPLERQPPPPVQGQAAGCGVVSTGAGPCWLQRSEAERGKWPRRCWSSSSCDAMPPQAQLKEQCLSVVGASEGLAQQLSRRERWVWLASAGSGSHDPAPPPSTRLILEKQERTEQLCAALQGTPLAEAKAVQLPQLPQARRGRGSVTFDPAQAEVCDAADFAEGLAAALLCEGPAQRVLPT